MSKFSVVLGDETISIYYKGKQYSFSKETDDYDKVVECIRNNDTEAFEQIFIIDPKTHLQTLTDGQLDWRDDAIWIGTPSEDKKLPEDLYKAFLEIKKLGLSYDRLIAFAHKLLQHPEPASVEQFYSFLRTHKLTICDDGDFIAYKGVREDFMDMHTGTVNWAPGQNPKMDRVEVDHDRDSLCSRGLHVCAWEYLSFFGGAKRISVKVDPRNVVSVPSDHNDAKIRICEGLVLEEIDRPIDHIVSDVDKKVTRETLSDEEKQVLELLEEEQLETKNVFFFLEDEKLSCFVIGEEEWEAETEMKDEGAYLVSVTPDLFKDGVRLLKNKKGGYYEPMLKLRQAYRKGLVKQLHVEQEYADCILQWA